MTDVDPHDVPGEAVTVLQEYHEDEHEFLSWLDFTVEAFDAGRMVASVPFDGKLTNRRTRRPSKAGSRPSSSTWPGDRAQAVSRGPP